ncbi:MAG: AI-2E family transporter [Chloroflexota bacterium]
MNNDAPQETPQATAYSTAPKWDVETTSLVKMGFAIALVGLGIVFWSIIPLLLSTVVVTYLLRPFTNFFTNRLAGGNRGFGVLLTFIFLFIIVIAFFLLLIPPLFEQTVNGITSIFIAIDLLWSEPIMNGDSSLFNSPDGMPISLSEYVTLFAQQQGVTTFNDWIIIIVDTLQLDRDSVQEIATVGGGITTVLVGSVFSLAGSTIGFIFSSLFFFTILGSLLVDGKRFIDIIVKRAPSGYEEDTVHLLADLGNVWNGYIRGNATVGLIMGVVMWIFATILDLPNPLFLAFVAFSMEFIPTIGAWITMICIMIMALVGGSATFPEFAHLPLALTVGVIWQVMVQIQAIFIAPRIVGENLGLHPVAVILAVIWM